MYIYQQKYLLLSLKPINHDFLKPMQVKASFLVYTFFCVLIFKLDSDAKFLCLLFVVYTFTYILYVENCIKLDTRVKQLTFFKYCWDKSTQVHKFELFSLKLFKFSKIKIKKFCFVKKSWHTLLHNYRRLMCYYGI